MLAVAEVERQQAGTVEPNLLQSGFLDVGAVGEVEVYAVGDEEGTEGHVRDHFLLDEVLQDGVQQVLCSLQVPADVVDELRVVLVSLHDAQDGGEAEGRERGHLEARGSGAGSICHQPDQTRPVGQGDQWGSGAVGWRGAVSDNIG